jgi:hypothetical protein
LVVEVSKKKRKEAPPFWQFECTPISIPLKPSWSSIHLLEVANNLGVVFSVFFWSRGGVLYIATSPHIYTWHMFRDFPPVYI